ncbi:hypothetical protein [Sinorhizobium meliloti]|uniref:hypothetical protein n=1 Tax=Rhizobium meliloti TaxID=382 RepID=UPI000FDCD9D3|nr:hypothetical protein [Sinorhizobium meliloti]RVN04076.1 hypothetical protein CN112_26090 [Sinorhizobium meliloti]
MNPTEIQKRIDTMPAAMSAKGKRLPGAEYRIAANEASSIMLRFAKPGSNWADEYHYVKGKTPSELLANADAWIAALPTAEEARMKEFMTALSDVIELGRKSGVEVEFVNPLVETMKRLSSNIITDQRVAA